MFLRLDRGLYCPPSYRDLASLLLKEQINTYMQSDGGAECARCRRGKGFGSMTSLSIRSWDCNLAFSLNRFSTCCIATVSWIFLYIVSFKYRYAVSLVYTYFRLLPLSLRDVDIVGIGIDVDIDLSVLFLAVSTKVS